MRLMMMMKKMMKLKATKTFAIILLFSLCCSIKNVKASGFSYDDQDHWPNENNQCGGANQSPIDILTSDVFYNSTMNLEFIGYDYPSKSYKVTNNGHSIQFDFEPDMSGPTPAITGSALQYQEYQLAQFHFHWGSAKHIGSEHKINGRAFPVEMHLVHYKKKHGSLSKALEARDGSVAVLGIFFEIKTSNPGFEAIGEAIGEVGDTAQPEASLETPVVLEKFLPKNREKFYRYHGSLTTPPCTEGLVWLVMNQPTEIGRLQFEKFLAVINHEKGDKMSNNFRRIQPLNGRKIESSFNSQNKAGMIGSAFQNFLVVPPSS